MTLLDELRQNFQRYADLIPNFSEMTKTELANKYCDAEEMGNEFEKSKYFSGLMIKYWYMIPFLAEKSRTLRLPLEDFTTWLCDAIMLAMQYKRWRDPTHELYNNQRGAEIVINRAIDTIRVRAFYQANLDKNKLNYEYGSLDEYIEVAGDAAENSVLSNEADYENNKQRFNLELVIQSLITRNKIKEALVLDSVCFWDTTNDVRITRKVEHEGRTIKISDYQSEFSERKLVAHLTTLNEDYIEYFLSKYSGISENTLLSNISVFTTNNKTKVYNIVRHLLDNLKHDEIVMESIMG